jgi:hypothetical protein
MRVAPGFAQKGMANNPNGGARHGTVARSSGGRLFV